MTMSPSSTSRCDMGTNKEESGKGTMTLHQKESGQAEREPPRTSLEEGECSDSDALLPTAKQELSTRERLKKGEVGLYREEGEACSPLLHGSSPQSDNGMPSLMQAISPCATTTDDDSASTTYSQSKSNTQRYPEDDSNHLSPTPMHQRQGSLQSDLFSSSSSPLERSSSMRRHRSASPCTQRQQEPQQQSSPNMNNILSGSALESTLFPQNQASAPQPYSSQERLPYATDQVEGFLPTSLLNSPVFLHRRNSAPPTPSVSSSHSNSSRDQLGGGIRRFVRSRAITERTGTTVESSSSQISTQSLGDEDLFALTLNGEDPRLPISSGGSTAPPPALPSTPPPPPQQQQQTQRALWDAARMHSSENFPPIVWEESSDSEPEINRERRRRRTFSEPSGHRLRGFLFPSPGVRRRVGSRQSRSVRRHLPRSSSTSSANMLAASPLSTTAAAVLFTSSQASQASIDSFQEYALSPNRLGRSRQASRQRPNNNNNTTSASSNPPNQRRLSSNSLDDSARAGLGTTSGHRTIVMDGTAGDDRLSISTIGNSTMARSDPTGLGESGRQSSRGRNLGSSSQARGLRETNAAAVASGAEGMEANATDPDREARIRWVRINQRFQLMITFVAVCFSLLLFSILISWIVLTSAYVVTFEKECDIPLKFFYWLVTLQLILDVFRNDIMRYILQWDPNAHTPDSTHRFIPARVVAYNIAYLAYALLVLRMGINCVYIEGRQPESTCRQTAPELFQSSVVFVTLTLGAWGTIILGYIMPFCVVAMLLTLNGYNPGEADGDAAMATSPIPGGVFPSAYSSNGAPPGTIERLREVDLDECGEQECCICMEDFRTGRHNADDAIVQTDCGHILHKNCCSVWLRQARTCPVCRTDIPNAQEERLRQQQAELGQQGDSNENLEQQEAEIDAPSRVHHHHHPTPVAPHLPFRPAGRREVATLINAFRQPRREERGRRRRRPSGSQNSNTSERSRRSLNNQSAASAGSRRNEDTSSNIEITALNRRGDSTSTLQTSEANGHTTSGGNGVEVQYVL